MRTWEPPKTGTDLVSGTRKGHQEGVIAKLKFAKGKEGVPGRRNTT